MTQLPWLLRTAASGLASLGCAGAVAGGFQWVAGQPNALPLHPLPIALPAGRSESGPFAHWFDAFAAFGSVTTSRPHTIRGSA